MKEPDGKRQLRALGNTEKIAQEEAAGEQQCRTN